MKTLNCLKLGLWDKASCPVFRNCAVEDGTTFGIAKLRWMICFILCCSWINLVTRSRQISSEPCDRNSFGTEKSLRGFAMLVVKEMNLNRKGENLLLRQAWWKERKWRLTGHLKLFCQLSVFDEHLSIVISCYVCLLGKLGQLFVTQERNLNERTRTVSLIVFN